MYVWTEAPATWDALTQSLCTFLLSPFPRWAWLTAERGQKGPSNRCGTKKQQAFYLFTPALCFTPSPRLSCHPPLSTSVSVFSFPEMTLAKDITTRREPPLGLFCSDAVQECGRPNPNKQLWQEESCMQFTVADTVIWNRAPKHMWTCRHAHRHTERLMFLLIHVFKRSTLVLKHTHGIQCTVRIEHFQHPGYKGWAGG